MKLQETRLQSKVENNRKTLVNREARTHSETPRGTRKHGEQCCKKCATKSKDKGGNPKKHDFDLCQKLELGVSVTAELSMFQYQSWKNRIGFAP